MPAITSSRTVQKAEAKYNVTTEYPNYGLHSAAATGNLGLVSFALTNGQPTNAVLDGVLPIHAAASGGNTRVVRMLIDAGADLNIGRLSRKLGAGGGKGRSGVPAGASGSGMGICTTSGGSHIGTGGSTALHFAAANGHVDALTLLLRCGADLNRADKHSVTPLMLADSLGQTQAAATLRAWASANPQHQPTPSVHPSGVHSLKVKSSLETLLRRPWGGSRIDINRPDPNASRIHLGTGDGSRGDLGSGSSGVDLGSGSSQTELGDLGFLPPMSGTTYQGESRRPSLPTSAGLLFSSKSHRPRSNRTSWSGGRMRRFFSRTRRGESASWDAGERTGAIDWAEEVEFRRGERVAVEMGLKAPSAAALLASRTSSQNGRTIRARRKASEFHPDPEYDFLFDDELSRDDLSVVIDDDDDMDDDDLDMPPKRALHPRSFSHSGAGFSRSAMGRLTSPSMPILPLPGGPSLMSSAATSSVSIIPIATSPQPTPSHSHAPSPSNRPAHARSTSGSSITRRGLRAASSFNSSLPRQPEEPIVSSGESTVAGSALIAADSSFQPQEPTDGQDLLQPPDSRFRGDSLSSTSSENTNQLSSSMATTDTGMTTPSLHATTPLPPHKGAMTFSPVFEADDLDEVEEPEEETAAQKRNSIPPLNLRTVSTFAQAQSLVRQVEREILEPGPQGPDSPSLAEQLAAYGETLAIERRFARGEAQRRAWQAERKSQEDDRAGDDDDDDDDEGGWANYARDQTGPRIGAPLGRAASVDYQAGSRFKTIRSPTRTHSTPVHQLPGTPSSGALKPPFSPSPRSSERSSFSGALPHSHSRQTSISRVAMIPRRTASSHSSYVSRPSSIEIIETAATPVDSPPYRSFELHRRSASTGVSGFPWAYNGFGALALNQSPEHSDDADSHYELNSHTAPLSRITTAPSKIGNAIGNAFSRDPNYEPVRRRKLKRLVKQLVHAERPSTDKETTIA